MTGSGDEDGGDDGDGVFARGDFFQKKEAPFSACALFSFALR